MGLREEGEKPRRKWGSVAETLGHANIKITLDIYSHVLPNMGDVVADTMDAALGLSYLVGVVGAGTVATYICFIEAWDLLFQQLEARRERSRD